MGVEISNSIDSNIGNPEKEIQGIEDLVKSLEFEKTFKVIEEVQKSNEKNKETEKALKEASEQLSKINTFLDKNPLYRSTVLDYQLGLVNTDIQKGQLSPLKTHLENVQHILQTPEDIVQTFGGKEAFPKEEAITCAKNLIGEDLWNILTGVQRGKDHSYLARHIMFNVRDNLGSLRPLENLNKEKNKNRIITLLYKIAGCTGVTDHYTHRQILKNLLTTVYFKDTNIPLKEQAIQLKQMINSVSNMATGDGPGSTTRGFGFDAGKMGSENEIGKELGEYNTSGQEYFKNTKLFYLDNNINNTEDLSIELSIRGMDLQDKQRIESYGYIEIQYTENGKNKAIKLNMSQNGLSLENEGELAKIGIKYKNKELILPNHFQGKELTLNMTSSKYKDGSYDEEICTIRGYGSFEKPVKEGNGEVIQGNNLGDTELDTETRNKFNQDVSEYFSLRDYFPSNAKKEITLMTGVCGTTMDLVKYEAKKDKRDKKIQQARDLIGDPQISAKVFKHLDFGNTFSPEEAPKQEKLARCRMAELFLANRKLVDIVKENINNLKVVGPDGKEDNFHGESNDQNARTVGFSWSVTKDNTAFAK